MRYDATKNIRIKDVMESGGVQRIKKKGVICKGVVSVLVCNSIDIDCFTISFAGAIEYYWCWCGWGEIHEGGIAPADHLVLQDGV